MSTSNLLKNRHNRTFQSCPKIKNRSQLTIALIPGLWIEMGLSCSSRREWETGRAFSSPAFQPGSLPFSSLEPTDTQGLGGGALANTSLMVAFRLPLLDHGKARNFFIGRYS